MTIILSDCLYFGDYLNMNNTVNIIDIGIEYHEFTFSLFLSPIFALYSQY